MVEGFAPFFSQHPLQLNRIRVQGRLPIHSTPSRALRYIYIYIECIYIYIYTIRLLARRSHFHTRDYKPLILTSRPGQNNERRGASLNAIPLTVLNFLSVASPSPPPPSPPSPPLRPVHYTTRRGGASFLRAIKFTFIRYIPTYTLALGYICTGYRDH